jgi:hypothetical protein
MSFECIFCVLVGLWPFLLINALIHKRALRFNNCFVPLHLYLMTSSCPVKYLSIGEWQERMPRDIHLIANSMVFQRKLTSV